MPVRFADVIDVANVGMRQFGRQLRLAIKPIGTSELVCALKCGTLSATWRSSCVSSAKGHAPHAAANQRLEDAIPSELLLRLKLEESGQGGAS